MAADPLREILLRTTARYLTVRPEGIRLGGRLCRDIEARILSFGGARTLYRGRKPHCRSLNGIASLQGTSCAACREAKHCTPQTRVDLFVQGRPYRLLLSFSSAKNFLLYLDELRRRDLDLAKIVTRLSVIDRHTWGELRFTVASDG